MNLNSIKVVNSNVNKFAYSTKAPAVLPFEHWLKDVTINNSDKVKSQRKVAKSAVDLAKQAVNAFDEINKTFIDFLQKHKLDKSVDFKIRSKKPKTAAIKANMETKNMYKDVEKELSHLKDLKVNINDVLPENKKKVPEKFHGIYDETRQLLAQKAQKGMLGFKDFTTIVDQQEFSQKYGKDGAAFAKRINTRLKNALSLKIKTIFTNIQSGTAQIEKYAGNIDNVSAELRDNIGVRLVIKNPTAARIQDHPQEQQAEYIKNHMERQIERITDLFVDMHNEKKGEITKVTLYGGDDSYLKKANVQKIQSLGDVNVKKNKLPNNYVTTQGNMSMAVSNEKKPIRVEFQIRGEEVNKFAEIEHIPYDLREGKSLDLNKYNKEQRILIHKIQKAAKQLSQNAELKKKYDEYLSHCFEYSLGKEYGIAMPEPVLPEGLDSALSKESLLKLARH